MILMALVIGAIEPIFFSTNNLFNVLRQVCSSTILAMGFTFILGLGEIDLSVGAILGLNGVIMAKLMVEMTAYCNSNSSGCSSRTCIWRCKCNDYFPFRYSAVYCNISNPVTFQRCGVYYYRNGTNCRAAGFFY